MKIPILVREELGRLLEKYDIQWDKMTDSTHPGDDCSRYSFWDGRYRAATIEVGTTRHGKIGWRCINIYPTGRQNGNSEESTTEESTTQDPDDSGALE